MNTVKLMLLVGTALATSAGAALAQTPPAPPPAQPQTPPPAQDAEPSEDEATAVEEVVVEGRNTDVRTSIDSVSYSLADDLQARTGTLADALRNVPSVDVDPQGNVSLRGDSNVTILIDGRPSGMLSGEGRAQALLQLPADQYARIEVMTNPSAAYRPDGSGGVINLITKPTVVRPGATTTGSVRVNAGEEGRYNVGLSAAFSRDRLTLSGDVGVRHDMILQDVERVRERFDAGSGQFLESRQTQQGESILDARFGRFTAEYRLTDKTQLTGEIRAQRFGTEGDTVELFEGEDASGSVAQAYRRDSDGGFAVRGFGATARVLHRFDDQGHEWSTELRLDRGRNQFEQLTVTDATLPAGADVYELLDNRTRFSIMGLTSAYVRPLSDGGKLRAGYELEMREPETSNAVSRGPSASALTPDPLVTNEFHAEQAVHAVYGTWERPFGKLTAQAGLRLEYTEIDLDQITTGTQDSNEYFRAYPTLHLGYELSETQTLRASYSRRIQRPQPFELNPFLVFQDPFNYRAGNPQLEPQETDSFELMWQRRVQQTFYQATLYYRDTTKAFTQVTTDIGGGIFLTRPENLGARRDMGLELTASGKLSETLRYNASVNLFHQEIDATGLSGAQDSSGTVVSGRGNLNWQPTAEDFVQLAAFWQGDSLQAQGVREAGGMINLGYRRKLTEKWAFQATVRDVFDQFGDVTTFDTPSFRERTERRFGGRAWYLGLTYSFGQGPRRQEPQFDFAPPSTGG
ncbi:outer membrane beta-barrel family protein [Brevundimonas sp.]|uniref:outer membrane beta-barrel family protein n=1 Tax=Brevundimonas sp. TaxID=1871086 RepID=UPI002D4B76A7|nr:outer membrane beta-barrel family protein [Brevundimonas sp.]HYC66880.1 outer membrane beta-barrel family protein [Brevundimonas sp.]